MSATAATESADSPDTADSTDAFDVSVLVDCPAGTDQALLRATVGSALAQTLARTEIVLAGDGIGDSMGDGIGDLGAGPASGEKNHDGKPGWGTPAGLPGR